MNVCQVCGGALKTCTCAHVLEAPPAWGVALLERVAKLEETVEDYKALCEIDSIHIRKLEAALSKLHDIDNEPIFEPEPYSMGADFQ